jgi:DUF1365 family protein
MGGDVVRLRPPATPALVVGSVVHTRHRPVRHRLAHRHYQWLVDLDELPRLPRGLSWLARFDATDHLERGRAGGGIRADLERFLALRGVLLRDGDRVLMLAHARVLRHVFDPLTVYWCLSPDGELRALVFEVHNTYGGRHAYLLRPDDTGWAEVDKAFHVSPFNDVSGRYRTYVRLDPVAVRVAVALDRRGERVLTAVVSGRLLTATTGAVLRVALRHAFMPHRVSALIRLHGVALWMRRLPVQPRPRRAYPSRLRPPLVQEASS